MMLLTKEARDAAADSIPKWDHTFTCADKWLCKHRDFYPEDMRAFMIEIRNRAMDYVPKCKDPKG